MNGSSGHILGNIVCNETPLPGIVGGEKLLQQRQRAAGEVKQYIPNGPAARTLIAPIHVYLSHMRNALKASQLIGHATSFSRWSRDEQCSKSQR